MNHVPIRIGCGVIRGVDAIPIQIEVSLRSEGNQPRILGQANPCVREAYFRIQGAFRNQGIPVPRGVPTINLSPASLRKSGAGFDLPMALGLLAAAGEIHSGTGLCALGEVALSGEVLPTSGVVAVALAARQRGWDRLLCHPESAQLAARVPGVHAFGVRDLREAVEGLRGDSALLPCQPSDPARHAHTDAPGLDLADIRGHDTAKTALLVAAAGGHNLLLVGPPGSGKTALAQRLPSLLPDASDEEVLEILKIHTARGLGGQTVPTRRPFRAPHHSSSAASILGGGRDPGPGELSLAQHGVLFLDELPEFRREVLEGLRQPLEDRVLQVGRVERSVRLPADCIVAAAMNPCPCGYQGHRFRPCICTPRQRQRYQDRISGPLLDRLDLQVEVPALPAATLQAAPEEQWRSSLWLPRVQRARERQLARNQQLGCAGPNARLQAEALEAACQGGPGLERALLGLVERRHLSGRARVRVMRLARTLADLDDRERVAVQDLRAALRLRNFDAGVPR